jgi:hypothetical protein
MPAKTKPGTKGATVVAAVAPTRVTVTGIIDILTVTLYEPMVF